MGWRLRDWVFKLDPRAYFQSLKSKYAPGKRQTDQHNDIDSSTVNLDLRDLGSGDLRPAVSNTSAEFVHDQGSTLCETDLPVGGTIASMTFGRTEQMV